MAVKVSYKQGSKATYLALLEKNPYALYFCTDTKELFRGEDLYSDGLRIVENYDALPKFAVAADGVLYYCKDTGCGYVLNEERNGWSLVIYGIDNNTLKVDENGLLRVDAIPMAIVTGLAEELQRIESKIVIGVKGSDEIRVAEDGTLSLGAVAQHKITGLEDRLTIIEENIVGGIHYRGAVGTIEELPVDASIGDLYEVYADNSEWCWNGEQWFEYGKAGDMSRYTTKDEVRAIARMVPYEITHKPVGTLVNYTDGEIRIMMPADMQYSQQNVGPTGDASKYYIALKAYAPSDDVVSFKEDMAQIITDNTMHYFEDNSFAGIDSYGRKYSIVWLAVATHDVTSDTWTYYGEKSTAQRYIGWDYSVEWFNAEGVKVAADTIRINLSNKDCHLNSDPYYMGEIHSALDAIEEAYTWGEI